MQERAHSYCKTINDIKDVKVEGYLREEKGLSFLNWLDDHGIPMTQIHTSGHASIADLQRLAIAINAKTVVPIHSFESGRFPEFFDKVAIKQDGVWWEI